MEENHNGIEELSVSAPEAVDTEKAETAAERAADVPGFLKGKLPDPPDIFSGKLPEVVTEKLPEVPAFLAGKEAHEAPAAESANEEVLPAGEPVTEEAATEEPVTEEAATEEAVSGEAETAEGAGAEETVPAAEPAGEESAEEEAALAQETAGAEESAAEEAAPEIAAAAEEEETAEKAAPPAHKVWNTEDLPVIEDVLGIEETAENEEKPQSSGAIQIPFLGGKKDRDEEEEEKKESSEEGQEEEVGEEEQEKEKFSLKMPSGSVRRILIAGIVILAIILVYSVIQSRRVYRSYEIMSTVLSSDDASTSYQVNKNGMIRYSNNGIALTDKSGNVIWNQTYEMNNPIIASAGNYIAAGDRGASTLYIFNQYGQCGKLTTDLPIQGMQMAENGVVAAILSDAESNFINLYDKQGNRLVGIRATLENTGYPLAVGVSPDASKLVVSYLTVSESARTETKLVFYDFGMMNGEHEKLTGVLNDLCPRIQFLGQQRVAVFREKGFDIYSVDGDVRKVSSTEFENEIRSVFTGDQKLGFVFRNRDENGKYRIELYDVSGQKSMTIYSDLDYVDLRADSDEVVLFNSKRAEIYKFNGKQVFGGDFENRITAVMPSWDTGMYWMVEDSRLCEIRVK